MSPEVYWFATTDDQARETVEKIKATGIHPHAVAVAAKPAKWMRLLIGYPKNRAMP